MGNRSSKAAAGEGGSKSKSAAKGVDVASKYKREEKPRWHGGFGDVYLCRHEGRDYIMKVARKDALSEIDLTLAWREVDLLQKLNHSNVVKYVDSFQDGPKICIVMEYCVLGDLHSYVLKYPEISDIRKWAWFYQVGSGLEYIHSAKVMHRDLTPKNIFLTQDLTLKIGDFGLAKLCTHSASMTRSRQAQTELGYCSPEQLNTDKCSMKCDVWALGCILYFIVTGKKAFTGTAVGQVALKVVKNDFEPISDTQSQEFRDLTKWLMTVDMEERPSIREVMKSELVKKAAPTDTCLKASYKLTIIGDRIQEEDGGSYVYDRYQNYYDNETRYQGVATHVTEYIYHKIEGLGLQRQSVPVECKGSSGEGTVIFVSPDWLTCKHLIVLIPGGNKVKAGQWACRIIINKSIMVGSQIPYIEKALKKGYGVISLNINDYRPNVEGCTSPIDHGLYVWKHFIKHCRAVKIAVVSHSDGEIVTAALYEKYEEDFKKRVFANAYTGSHAIRMPVNSYTKAVTNSWIKTNPVQPLGTVIPANGGLGCVSAETSEHSETPHAARKGIFKFIEENFNRDHPEGF